ncbi:hypothetical protein GIB67_034099 [Kingdonia uniflora]|uniref:Dihydrolipoamide acetyltransferase component of pyruvate dehydrogenase complex n=1 Tax=Kingdonia uniflora TaxID=39325 RepID=A0A7J7M6G8_9MAGN|nr:hypothetical protein GIB67_034099 [Kingdonia uniflora]
MLIEANRPTPFRLVGNFEREMAVFRLRQLVLSKSSPSLFRTHHSATTSSRSLSHLAYAQNPSLEDGGNGSLLRPLLLPMVNGAYESTLLLKPQIVSRYLSTSELPSHIILGMPALSPTMNQGNIAKWRKKEGDKIEVGDVLCEIETDKATLEFESQEEGFLAKILAPEGSKDVPVGQPIAMTVEDMDDLKNIPTSIFSGSEAKEEKSNLLDVGIKISSAELPSHIVLEMPALSPTMNQGNIATWRKKEGDKIEVGDVICEIETDKATLEFECLEEGYLAKILAPEGSKDVAVGQPIAITVEDPDDIAKVSSITFSGSDAIKEESTHQDLSKEGSSQVTSFARIGPSAKLLIKKFELDASSLNASGPNRTLLKGDVLAAIKSGKGSSRTAHRPMEKKPASPLTPPQTVHISTSDSSSSLLHADSHEDLPNTQIRKARTLNYLHNFLLLFSVIAKRLLESKQCIPHLYLSSGSSTLTDWTDVILDPLLAFRKELKEQHDIKVSVNDIVIKAVAVTLKNVPEANAFWNAEKGEAILCDSVDISIAVATEKGLMTPIIRNADQKTISSISLEVKELAEKARVGKLSPNEFQGGTFSISNLGMFPVDRFCAIINPPQACILAVGRGNKVVEPVVGSDGQEKPGVVTKMSLTLSADHRVFDGKVASSFLSELGSNFSDIRRLIL